MTNCCPHPDAEHHLAEICQAVIHYPSEDYPCLCTGFAGGPAEVCTICEHPHAQHASFRACTPANGDYCGCRMPV